jgi:hypothetical protein
MDRQCTSSLLQQHLRLALHMPRCQHVCYARTWRNPCKIGVPLCLVATPDRLPVARGTILLTSPDNRASGAASLQQT